MAHTLTDHGQAVSNNSWPRNLLLCALLVISGCESLPGDLGAEYSVTRAQRLYEAGDYNAAASGWMALASNTDGIVRDGYVLKAAESWLAGGDRIRAETALERITQPVAPELSNDYHLGRAAIAAFDGDELATQRALSQTDPQRYTLEQRARADAIRGDLAFLAGDPVEAIALLTRRELWLGNEREIAANDQRIWEGLLVTDPSLLHEALKTTEDAQTAGWLALGLLANSSGAGGPSRGIVSWQRRYPGHPAMRSVVPGLAPDATPLGLEPRHVALLLPLSGRAAAFGSAIRDGVLSHYADRFGAALSAPRISIIDVTESGPLVSYQRAVEQDVDLIIGPVMRSSVDALATYEGSRVPTLLLNYPTVTERYVAGVFAFGLAPEDEARTAAARAYADGHRRAVAMVPTGDRGERLLTAFNEQFRAMGGEVLAYETYVPEAADHSDVIERLMLLNDSVARYRRMRSLIGAPLQFEPRRRADVDVIFLGATASNARQLKPQLRFHYSGDLPVIATSSVHNPSQSEPVADLNGIAFAEIPWLLDAMDALPTPLDSVRNALPNVRRQPRLHALGHDALTLALSIYAGNFPVTGLPGATGHLTLDNDGNFQRQTGWAQFSEGRPGSIEKHVEANFEQDILEVTPESSPMNDGQ